MVRKLPRWLLIGGGVLALSAGFVNSTALLGLTQLSVSHVTGNVTLFASAITRLDIANILFIGITLLSFLAGAVLSGLIVGQQSLQKGKNYGLALYTEAVLLSVSMLLYLMDIHYSQIFAAMACGLQNAMVATYSGAVIRTTHLTGLTSDMGSAIGNWLAGRPISKSTLLFQAIIWYCFCGGAVLGTFLYLHIQYYALIIPIIIVLGAGYLYNRFFHLPQNKTT